MSIEIKASELAREILESNEFKEFRQARLLVENNPEYKRSIKLLRDKQMEMQESSGRSEKSKNVEIYYNQLIKIPDIKRYLDAEKRFSQSMAGVFKGINDKIQSGLK